MSQLVKKLSLDQMQDQWPAQLNPVLANPLLQGQMLTGVALKVGTNIINHGLGRKLVGWLVVGISPAANISDNQASNQTPQLTLSLTSSAVTIISLWVF